ncbi:chemotaxis protein CheA [Geothrix sp. PMB-07]|uniref:chemotaxis protein CheA n=1 Tax=Geothrix sp. PMB-07 TaxID=3068640 RepID=UPI002741DC12|nr:chemotaxis protein CheA [Geothrix sp. PMB-07]WLT30328.1 chemotaxis protein CheA [Geothrix sp. PMB-07]
MSDPMAQFREAFFEEAAELANGMEATLLSLDLDALEVEDLHSLFRAAHSIKGNAGTFGFPAVAAFTHQLESTLEPVRQGTRPMTSDLRELLLQGVDLIRSHLHHARRDEALPPRDQQAQDALVARLQEDGGRPGSAPAESAPNRIQVTQSGTGFAIRFEAPRDAFRRGVNLERIFRDLARLGTLRSWPDLAALPAMEALDPEDCHLAWDLRLETERPLADVEEVFEFVAEGDNLRIQALTPAGAVPPLGDFLLADTDVSPADIREALALQKPLGELLVDMGKVKPEAVSKALDQQQKKRNQAEASTVRVATEKIDRLVNLVGELVITQAMLAQASQQSNSLQGEEQMSAALLQLDRQTRELQERVMGIRMVPVEMVFSRFPRMVHELGKQLGKDVELVMEGQATELDKTFIEMLVDPLTHLVRNAVDHGMETKEERLASGKPGMGTIALRASSRGGHIHIEVKDDGKGLNRDRIYQKALALGLLQPGNRPADEELNLLIFEPGFSTVEQISDLSGRGVGMDVVRQNVRSLGGRIEVESQSGRGTLIRLVLPLTLAILDGLTVRVADETFVFPLASVLESFQRQAQDVQTVKGDREVISLRGEFIPVVRLQKLLAVGAEQEGTERTLLVLVESEGRRAAMAVDELLGQQQVVIKSLETHYRRVEGISGATILGDGRVALILDVPGLMRLEAGTAAVGA